MLGLNNLEYHGNVRVSRPDVIRSVDLGAGDKTVKPPISTGNLLQAYIVLL